MNTLVHLDESPTFLFKLFSLPAALLAVTMLLFNIFNVTWLLVKELPIVLKTLIWLTHRRLFHNLVMCAALSVFNEIYPQYQLY